MYCPRTWRLPVAVFLCIAGVQQVGCTLDAEGKADGALDASAGGMGGSAGSGGVDASAGSGGGSGAGGSAGSTGGLAGESGAGGVAGDGGAGAGGVAGQGGTGGGPTAENCSDGIDNDGDGAADCADDECGALRYACVPPVPQEWIGYFRVHVQPNGASVPPGSACPSGGSPERYLNGIAAQAACGGCSCGDLTDALCAAPGIACDYAHGDCSGAVERPELGDFQCHSLDGGHISCRLTGVNPFENTGYCTPTPDVPDFPNKLPFSDVFDVCVFSTASSGAGCNTGDICLSPGSGEYDGTVCVMMADDQAICPPRWDAKQPIRLYKNEDTNDQRGCSACVCAPDLTSTQCVGGAYRVWDDDNCEGCIVCSDPEDVDSTSCKDVSGLADNGTISIRVRSRPAIQNGKCNPSGGEPVGFVETTKGVTICCL